MTLSPEVDYVIQRSLATRHELSPLKQRLLLSGLLQIVGRNSAERETITQAIFHLDRAEAEQLRLEDRFGGAA